MSAELEALGGLIFNFLYCCTPHSTPHALDSHPTCSQVVFRIVWSAGCVRICIPVNASFVAALPLQENQRPGDEGERESVRYQEGEWMAKCYQL